MQIAESVAERYGDKAQETVKELGRMLEDTQENIRKAAEEALKAIGTHFLPRKVLQNTAATLVKLAERRDAQELFKFCNIMFVFFSLLK